MRCRDTGGCPGEARSGVIGGQRTTVSPDLFRSEGHAHGVRMQAKTGRDRRRDQEGPDDHFRKASDEVKGGVATTISSLPHIGKTLNVIADGSVLSDEVVSGGGSITMDRASTTSYEVGLPFTVTIKTLPIEPRMSVGVRIGFVKRIIEVNALLYETQHLLVNDNLVPIRSFDTVGILDEAIPEFTGTKTVGGIAGYSDDAQITIYLQTP